jgi:hypothetical protein
LAPSSAQWCALDLANTEERNMTKTKTDDFEQVVNGWSHNEIRHAFDMNPDLSMQRLARRIGITVGELQKILMNEESK